MFEIRSLTWHDFRDTVCLYTACFRDDPWFAKAGISLEHEAPPEVQGNIMVTLHRGLSLGKFDGYYLIGGLLVLDTDMQYDRPEEWQRIFGLDAAGHGNEDLMSLIPEKSLYLLAGFVDPRRQRMGIYRALLQELMAQYPNHTMVSDISNLGPMPMYRRMGFEAQEIEPGYLFIKRPGIDLAY